MFPVVHNLSLFPIRQFYPLSLLSLLPPLPIHFTVNLTGSFKWFQGCKMNIPMHSDASRSFYYLSLFFRLPRKQNVPRGVCVFSSLLCSKLLQISRFPATTLLWKWHLLCEWSLLAIILFAWVGDFRNRKNGDSCYLISFWWQLCYHYKKLHLNVRAMKSITIEILNMSITLI